MTTHRTAHWILSIAIITGCLAITAFAGVEYRVSQSWAVKIDRLAANQKAQPPVWYPHASADDFIAAITR